jgi:hypothetical protein
MKGLRAPELIIALVVLGAFIAIGVLDFSNRQREVATYDSFSSFDYQRGGYRAWFEMLHNEGLRVTRYEHRPAYLNDSIGTLIIANNVFDAMLRAELGQPSSIYSTADLTALEKWVRNGGRLVWLVDEASSLGLPAGPSGVAVKEQEGRASNLLGLPEIVKTTAQKDAAAPVAPSFASLGVSAVLGSSRLRIPFTADPGITPLVADVKGSVVGWYPLGKGSVTVVTDESLFENGRLNKTSNARLAYNLAAFGLAPKQTIAFEEWSHGYQSGDTWWAILPSPFRLAFAIISVALTLLLFGATWRFGPALRLPENEERTSFEYLTSVASLLERGHATRKAVRDLAQLALRACARSVGLPDTATASSIAQRMRGSDAGDRRADDLLTLERIAGFEQPTSAELVRAAQIAINLRKELSRDGFQHIGPRRAAARRSA